MAIKYVWFPLCLVFALLSYEPNSCIHSGLLNSMWFMWLIMSLMHIEPYVDLFKGKD